MKCISTLCFLALLTGSVSADDARTSRIQTNLCVCEAASLGRSFSKQERQVCEARVGSLLASAPSSCVSCLDQTVGSSSATSACSAAKTSCTSTCRRDAKR